MGSKRKTTTTVTPSAPTANELALQQQQLQLGQAQLDAIQRAQVSGEAFNEILLGTDDQPGFLQTLGDLFGAQAQGAISDVQFQEALRPLEFENLRGISELQDLSIEQARAQVPLQQDITSFLRGQIADEQAGVLSPERQIALDLSQEQLESARAFGPVRDELSAQLLSQLQNFGQVDPERAGLIRELAESVSAEGRATIESGRARALRALRNELAPQLGLRSTDTPIIDRGGFVAEESLRQIGSLERGVRAAELQQLLAEPLANLGAIGGLALGGQQVQTQALGGAGQQALGLAGLDLQQLGLTGGQALGGGQLALAAQGVQFDLASRAAQNRLALTSQLPGFSQQGLSQTLGLISGFNPNTVGALGQQLQFRLGTAGTTTTERTSGAVPLIGAAGGFLTGLGAVVGGG